MRKPPLKILLVEDNLADARLLREMFSKEQAGSFEFIHFLRLAEALDHLAKGDIDIVLLDMGLPDAHGLDTVRRVHAVAPNVPVIVLTGLDDETMAAEAMRQGAQDYLIKGQIENRALPRALRHAKERHRLQAETDRIRTNQLQFKDEFLSHVSHELRSPLTAIYQFVTLLLDGLSGALTTEQHEHLEIVLRNVKQLHAMINDLLDVTRVQGGKIAIEVQSTSAADAIDYAVNTLQGAATAKGVALSAHIDSTLPSVFADPTRLRQILIILVDNAIKFTPENGTVNVRARIQPGLQKLVVIEVADTGCGISADMTERIFERLFQLSDQSVAGRKGLGLGLYICKELVMRQGGQIWARSAPSQGSVFSFTLPIFSLPNLIAPALESERNTNGPITLVVTELSSRAGWLSEETRAEHTHEMRALLEECLRSDVDVLLPRMGSAGATDLFFIVALTDATGGEGMTRRIRQRLDDSNYLEHAGLTAATSCRSVTLGQRSAADSTEDFLQKVASSIQDVMNEEISSRMVING